mmetsp:Transcript_25395/g.28193  ORF Transcript_25395/g.28193 Transcript_25395/m.28193 type:complete len:85 (-) Transcript_25395:3-257(-)
MFGKANVFAELLELGADIHIKTHSDETAITMAEKSLNKRIIQIFEEYRAMLEAEGGLEVGLDRNVEEKQQILTQSDPEEDDMMN